MKRWGMKRWAMKRCAGERRGLWSGGTAREQWPAREVRLWEKDKNDDRERLEKVVGGQTERWREDDPDIHLEHMCV